MMNFFHSHQSNFHSNSTGSLQSYSPPTLDFFIRFFLHHIHLRFPFLNRSCYWKVHERGDCLLSQHSPITTAMLVISGRLRSTTSIQSLKNHSRYRLQYQLSYDGGHCFSEREKREVAARMRENYFDGYSDDSCYYGGCHRDCDGDCDGDGGGKTREMNGQSEVNVKEIVVSVG